MKKKIVGIFVCTLLIATAVPIISGSGINNVKNLNQGNSEPGMINPEWISNADIYDGYDAMKIYEDYVYVSGYDWDPEEDTTTSIVCKIDTNDGNLIWKTSLLLFEDPNRIYDIEVFDQGIYVVGYLEYTNNYFLCKLDFNGDISWHQIITNEEDQILYGIATDNTYLYLCGKIGILPQQPRIIKMDTDGNEIWEKTYKPGYIIGEIVIDNGFMYCVGSTGNPQDFVLMKIDIEGNQIWNRTCGGPEYEIAAGITVKDGYVYATGIGGHGYLVKYDIAGELQWETNTGIYVNGLDVVIHDGYAYTACHVYNSNTGWEGALFKYDLDSNLVSYLTYPSSSSGRDLEIYDGYLYMTSFDYVLKYDMYQNLDNNKPSKPSTPSGPTKCWPIFSYDYKSTATDPDDNLVSLDFSWGDDTFSSMRWYDSGTEITASHRWIERGNYEIKVRARDEFGFVSEWSDPLPIIIPRNKAINTPFLQFLENHPNLFPILQLLLQKLGLY